MGTVYLIGAGPGDPGLITLKGLELLKQCDVVIYDRLASYQMLDYLREDCVKIYVGKKAGHHSKSQDEVNAILVEYAQNYETVVRLKGGDPFVFGRGGEEIVELQKYNIPFEVIPGVTSAIAVPESVGIPVTHRGISQSFHVITGHTKSTSNTLTDNYEVLAKLDGTLIFLMGLMNLDQITTRLIQNGKDENTPVAVISNGTMNNEKTIRGTLTNIVAKVQEEQIKSPGIIVIGETAALNFVQTERTTLSKINIGITGTKVMREKLEKGLQKLGAKVYTLCDMHIKETAFLSQLKEEINNIENYQWLVFTSQNAISIFFENMDECKKDRRCFNRIKFAVIGTGTQEALQKYGYFADYIPDKYTTKNLAEGLSQVVEPGEKVLIPRALRGSEELTEILQDKEINYKEIPIYDVIGNLTENIESLSEINCLVFASASGVVSFFENIKDNNITLPPNIKIACIGEVTVEAVKKYNLSADIIANESSAEGLIQEISNNLLN